MKKEPLTKIRFIENAYLKEYHSGEVDFVEFGVAEYVPISVAKYLLKVHLDKFELVSEAKPELVDNNEKKQVGRPAVKQKEIESRFGMPLNEILLKYKDMSVRELGRTLSVSKSLVSRWRRQMIEN